MGRRKQVDEAEQRKRSARAGVAFWVRQMREAEHRLKLAQARSERCSRELARARQVGEEAGLTRADFREILEGRG